MVNAASNTDKTTPLMKQYNAIKVRYPGALVLFRVGDFYETFGEDAVIASGILNITLTKRANGAASEVALAGFPYHALDNYLPKLVRAGQRVAICDQLEDPATAIGIVKRGVTELVTPGVVLDDNVLSTRQNNFLASVYLNGKNSGIAFADISTGEFFVSEGDEAYLDKLLQNYAASEVLYSKTKKSEFDSHFNNQYNSFAIDEWVFQYDYSEEIITKHFGTINLKGFGISELKNGIIAAGSILYYLAETEHKNISHLTSISRIEAEKFVWMDKFTIRNLELLFPQQDQGTPLIDIIDDTITPMGARLLRQWLLLPLKEKAAIDQRLQAVSAFQKHIAYSAEIRSHLKQVGDLERLISKIAARRVNPREMLALKRALTQLPFIKELTAKIQIPEIARISEQILPCQVLLDTITNTLQDEVPMNPSQGNFIRNGVDITLDDLRSISKSGKDYLLEIQDREIGITGISSLKISYNKVFGYYLEVTNAHKDKVPNTWIRKQTLTNAERYITEELKNYEEKILNAESNISSIELRIWEELITIAQEYVQAVQSNARLLAYIDCLTGFASIADKNQYVCPTITNDTTLQIEAGRHPVIEKKLPMGESYIPNNVLLDTDNQQIIIITGPNMAGKSALLRQTALICLMAQIGCFVPAASAQIGLVDKIFTRVGASDNLSKGESTFMVEMTETASILNNLSNRSLLLMDEIGRGTSTYDGVSIAWAIVEYLHKHPKFRARTLFATHYHELNELSNDFPRVKNFNVSVKQVNGKVVFLRKLQAGGSAHSFGIHVAQMAGMPNAIVLRANEIMQHLEKNHAQTDTLQKLKTALKNNYQLSFFEPLHPNLNKAQKLVQEMDINTISPVEALLKLNEIKKLLES